MPQWHPFTKIVAIFGVVAIGTLLWSEKSVEYHDIDSELHARFDHLLSIPSTQSVNSIAGFRSRRILDPITHFEVIIDRPLFSAIRNKNTQKFENTFLKLEEPYIRFFGTIEKKGQIIGLIHDGSKIHHLSEGQDISGWTVSKIFSRQLIIELDGKTITYNIFDLGLQ